MKFTLKKGRNFAASNKRTAEKRINISKGRMQPTRHTSEKSINKTAKSSQED